MLSFDEQVARLIDLQKGDKAAFNSLYYQYYQLVFRNISKFIYQRDIAEDILQEVFLALWEHRSGLDQERPVDSWLFVVSYNKSINWLKKATKEKERILASAIQVYDAEETTLHEEFFDSQVAVLNEAVDRLPLRKKLAFQLCKLEGRSYEEAAELLGISPETVKEYIKKSSQIIRKYVASLPASQAIPAIYMILRLSDYGV